MQNQFSRTQLLMGKPAINTLMGSRVAVFGVGGVGGYVVEALARSGVANSTSLTMTVFALQMSAAKY